MKLKIEIDDNLLRDAMRSGDYRTPKAAIEAGLRLFMEMRQQSGMRRLRGKVKWKATWNRLDSHRMQSNNYAAYIADE